MLRLGWSWTVVAAVLLAGCAAVTGLKPFDLGRSGGTVASPEDGYEDFSGILHVHTRASHDSNGRLEDVIRAAQALGIDFLILTEHNTLQPLRENQQGWHGELLLLVGVEVSTPQGHLLALGVSEEIDQYQLSTQGVVDAVNRQGGIGIIAHPVGPKSSWKDWGVTGITGMEIYTVSDDFLEESKVQLLWQALLTPSRFFYMAQLDRPDSALSKWDQLNVEGGRIVGVGSVDAHEVHFLGMKLPPYQHAFQLARTHLLVPSRQLTERQVLDALRQAHAYVTIPLLGDARGFTFLAEREGKVAGIMGDEIPWRPELRLSAWIPISAKMTLFRNGQRFKSTTAQHWQVPVENPGVYRLEVERFGRPWIFSNPIFIRRIMEE